MFLFFSFLYLGQRLQPRRPLGLRQAGVTQHATGDVEAPGLILNLHQLRQLTAQPVRRGLLRANALQVAGQHVAEASQVPLGAHAQVVRQLLAQDLVEVLLVRGVLDVRIHAVEDTAVDAGSHLVHVVGCAILLHHLHGHLRVQVTRPDDLGRRAGHGLAVPLVLLSHRNLEHPGHHGLGQLNGELRVDVLVVRRKRRKVVGSRGRRGTRGAGGEHRGSGLTTERMGPAGILAECGDDAGHRLRKTGLVGGEEGRDVDLGANGSHGVEVTDHSRVRGDPCAEVALDDRAEVPADAMNAEGCVAEDCGDHVVILPQICGDVAELAHSQDSGELLLRLVEVASAATQRGVTGLTELAAGAMRRDGAAERAVSRGHLCASGSGFASGVFDDNLDLVSRDRCWRVRLFRPLLPASPLNPFSTTKFRLGSKRNFVIYEWNSNYGYPE